MISSLLFMLFFSNCVMTDHNTDIIKPSAEPSKFEGKMIISDDFGKTWTSIDHTITNDLEIASVSFDEKNIYIGAEKAEILSIDFKDFNNIKQENTMTAILNKTPEMGNRVYAIFSCPSGQYAFTANAGLSKKANNGTIWQPISLPVGVYDLNGVVEDTNGNTFISTSFGIYRTDQIAKNWVKVYNYGLTKQMFIANDKIIVNGLNGIYQSENGGKDWSPIANFNEKFGINSNTTTTTLFQNGENLYVFGKNEDNMNSAIQNGTLIQHLDGNKLLFSKDFGATWASHPAEHYLKGQNNVQSIAIDGDKIYCIVGTELIYSKDNGSNWETILTMEKKEQNESFRLFVAEGRLICFKTLAGC
jgi:photosystem II stability/assembly factor-like uncharacterized protein